MRKMLNAHGLPRDGRDGRLRGFVRDFLGLDGVFTLRLMSANNGTAFPPPLRPQSLPGGRRCRGAADERRGCDAVAGLHTTAGGG